MNDTDFSPLAGPYEQRPSRLLTWCTWGTYALAIGVVAWRVWAGVV